MAGGGGRIDSPNINSAVVATPPAAPTKKAAKKTATTAATPTPEDPASGSGDAAEG